MAYNSHFMHNIKDSSSRVKPRKKTDICFHTIFLFTSEKRGPVVKFRRDFCTSSTTTKNVPNLIPSNFFMLLHKSCALSVYYMSDYGRFNLRKKVVQIPTPTFSNVIFPPLFCLLFVVLGWNRDLGWKFDASESFLWLDRLSCTMQFLWISNLSF